ncbi:MAG: DinB family protein [Planctomycetota bacterium]|nr:DinB family protein [Planctomycetota bacterium]
MDRTMIDRYEAGSVALAHAMEGLDEAHLDVHPIPGTWSIRELVVHLMDSDQVGSFRLKSVIAHDSPTIHAYDQDAFIARLHVESLDLATVLQAFTANRKATAQLLRALPD